ncbi:hypothetical protein [Streptomyces turgidiscabies]|uniref:hypothetical protein n=1 Tax=Streptomyces turgidiscabies TaxID=85558 RepID=UPI0027D90C9C|nr:hypothetical protein [Streptomyces turgidiscabies]
MWTIKNNSSKKSNYSWDWEAVNASSTRLANEPGQTAKGEFLTTLKSADGIKLNITSFNRTAGY